jgi:hypothetical protein
VGARRDSPKPRGGAKRAISHVADSYQGLRSKRMSWLLAQVLLILSRVDRRRKGSDFLHSERNVSASAGTRRVSTFCPIVMTSF